MLTKEVTGIMHKTENCLLRHKDEDRFLTWLLETLGPVIIGSKPAELISLSYQDAALAEKLKKIDGCIGKCRKICYEVFTYKNSSIKVLFYNPISLSEQLSDHRNRRFLAGFGYAEHYSLKECLIHLIGKIEDGCIPSEIGVFLGYPLKDIMGFIGHPSLKLTKVNGWRVYGDPKVSDIRFMEFSQAKNKMKTLLSQFSVEKVLYSFN